MLILKLLRFIFGYVSFTALGGFPERFINLCNSGKISLWSLGGDSDSITACTDCRSYKKLRLAAKKSGMRVRLRAKHGLPFFLNRHRSRVGIIPGLCLFAVILCVLSSGIWSIEVVGNSSVPSEEIKAVFEQLGVKKGSFSKNIDISAVEIAALSRLEDLLWVNINITGSSAVIEVRERSEIELEGSDVPADIVAARDGQLVTVQTYNGTQEQRVGNAVLKGDLIISGIEENKDLTVNFCRAQGYVTARTQRKIEAVQRNELTVHKISGEKSAYTLGFLGFSIPLGRADENAYKEKSEVRINGVTLPLYIVKCTDTALCEQKITLSPEQTQALAMLSFFEECSEQLRYLNAEEYGIMIENRDGAFAVTGEFVCLENIGREQAMNIDMTGE